MLVRSHRDGRPGSRNKPPENGIAATTTGHRDSLPTNSTYEVSSIASTPTIGRAGELTVVAKPFPTIAAGLGPDRGGKDSARERRERRADAESKEDRCNQEDKVLHLAGEVKEHCSEH